MGRSRLGKAAERGNKGGSGAAGAKGGIDDNGAGGGDNRLEAAVMGEWLHHERRGCFFIPSLHW